MNNSKRSIGFVIAFMTVISIITFILPNINLESLGNSIEVIFPNILFFLFIIVFSSIQFIFRLILTSKYYIRDKIFFFLDIVPSKIYNRLIFYLGIFILFLWPAIASKNLSFISIKAIINLIIWIFITEILLYITYKYTKIHFMTDGILIRGLDFRIDVPLNDKLSNHSGFYPYYNIQKYTVEKNKLILYLYNSTGSIEGYITSDKLKAVAAFLESKKIKHIDKNQV
ncbi:hypothetical protein [Maledivibacter halophilus]|uniref:Uncharacterized protein n=1 Tax=Maledivibacter halophilus TaxID=36842 RepID=A0A1T5JIG2_9FIRM|nr:hypothetical protein [Maledivibacter halophilus]SKC51219.1 hypothetical protein SAMN02194393_01215 [Maledivibacter halophilus]